MKKRKSPHVALGMAGAAAVLWLWTAPALATGPIDATDPIHSIDQQLHRGEWEAAAKAALEAVAAARASPFGRATAAPLARLALAEAGLGREADAVWHWQVALNLDPNPLSAAALSAFGPPGELLGRNRLRSTGRQPAGLDVRSVPHLQLRRLQGTAPKLSPEVQRLPLPKWLRVQLVIDAEGRPRDPVVLGGGLPGMTWEVLEAVRDWRFEPFQVSSGPVPVFYQLSINPPAGRPLAEMLQSDPLLTEVETLLRAGEWRAAEKRARRSWTKMLGRPSLGRPGLAAALTLLALAEAANGKEAEAICRWQAAQNVAPEIYQADLSAYGAAGALLARNRWGDALPDLVDQTADVRPPTPAGFPFLHFLPPQLAGSVLVAGVVDVRGGLRQPVALSTSALTDQVRPEALEAGALEAVCGWRFHPALSAGQPVAMAHTVVFRSSPWIVSPYSSFGPESGLRQPAWTPPPGHTPTPHPWDQN
jgi:tetratricopeptide (TPR) repeat protein